MNFGNKRFISGNTLKILAAIFMVVDHAGLMFFPQILIFRYIGRISMPIFAFMISEGCRYTKNKVKYFLSVFVLAAICQTAYAIFDPKNLYFSILVTFSLSILVVYSLNFMKKCWLMTSTAWSKKIASAIIFVAVVVSVSLINRFFTVDYGFWGCMLPAFASLFDFRGIDNNSVQKFDKLYLRVLTFAVGLIVRVVSSGVSYQVYALLAIPLLLLYSGNRGKYKMKYFFYVFYPTHLVVLEGILMLTKMI